MSTLLIYHINSFTFSRKRFPICQPLNHYRGLILAGFFNRPSGKNLSGYVRRNKFNFFPEKKKRTENKLESFICVWFAITHRDQSWCLRPQHRCKTSMTSPIHTASSPHISHALSRHIPQQREMPQVIIHQNEPFMAHQKTMNCQSERSARNMK